MSERETPGPTKIIPDNNPWIEITDGDPRATAIYSRHYSARPSRSRHDLRIAGPGQKMVLLTLKCDALLIWRKFRSLDRQEGISCAVFRNESGRLSSRLILHAEELARARWPDETRLYTYVNPRRVKGPHPGYCFKKAGWQLCGATGKGLLILEKVAPAKEPGRK